MTQLNSVERTTMIELFSTFFDRLTSNHPQREMMLKNLYHFKSHLYSNDSMNAYFEELVQTLQEPKYLTQQCHKANVGNVSYQSHQNDQKSPLKRENSQSRQKSIKKDDNKENVESKSRSGFQQELSGRGQKTPTSKVIKNNITKNQEEDTLATSSSTGRIGRQKNQNLITTSCGHEFEKEIFEQYVNQQLQETTSVKCPLCCTLLPPQDCKGFVIPNIFEEFKQKTIYLLKTITMIENSGEEFLQNILHLEQDDSNKQRCSSGTGIVDQQIREQSQSPILNNLSAMGYSRMASVGEDRTITTSQMALQIMRKCLRCNKDIGNIDNKSQLSCFCANCKNF